MKKRTPAQVLFELLKLVKPLINKMALAIIFGVCGFLAAIFIPVLGSIGILQIINKEPILQTTILMILLGISRGIFRYTEQYFNHDIAFSLLAVIRDKVFGALRKLAPAKLETKSRGKLVSTITGDIELLEVFYAHTISPIIIAVITSIIMIIYLGQIHFIIGLLALIAYTTVGGILPLILNKIRGKQGEGTREQVGAVMGYLLDSIEGIKESLMFQTIHNRTTTLMQKTQALNKKLSEIRKIDTLAQSLTSATIYFFDLLILGSATALYLQGQIAFTGVLIALVTIMSSFGPVIALTNMSAGLVRTIESGNRVLDLMSEQPAVIAVENGITNLPAQTIEMTDVDFQYKDVKVLDAFNLEVNKGEILGLVGKSGKGKSTILKLLMRFWDATSGTIKIDENNIKEINTTTLRKAEGYITQDTYLFQKSILENIKIAKPDATIAEVKAACERAAISDFIKQLPNGYDTLINELGENFSSGQRQRLGLARIFLHNSEIILLDEPTSNLDALNERAILLAIKQQMQDKLVIIVSHKETTIQVAGSVIEL